MTWTSITKAELATIGADICQHLDGFTLDISRDYDHAVDLWHADGRNLFIRSPYGSPNKLHISGHASGKLWDAKRYDEHLPSINVAATKTGKQIAADITRRLLPEYTELFARLVERAAATDDYHAKQDALVVRVSQIFRTTLRETREYRDAIEHRNTVKGPRYNADMYLPELLGYGHVKVSGDRITLELTLSPEQAERVAEVLLSREPATVAS